MRITTDSELAVVANRLLDTKKNKRSNVRGLEAMAASPRPSGRPE